MVKIIKVPKAEQWRGDHYHECQECEAYTDPESCVELAVDCVELECYACVDAE